MSETEASITTPHRMAAICHSVCQMARPSVRPW